MISINDKVTALQELATYQMERDVEISDSHDVLVDAFLLDSDKKEQQLKLATDTLNQIISSVKGIEGLVLYNTERLSEVETLITEPEEEIVASSSLEEPQDTIIVTQSPLLEQGKLSTWVWALMIILFLFNAWILIKMFVHKKVNPSVIPATYIKDSLDWLNTDLINDEKKTDNT